MKKIYKLLPVMLFTLMTGFAITSCSSDDDKAATEEPKAVSIVGRWENLESYTSDEVESSIKMVLTFNSDRTGSIEEYWAYQTKASSNETYSMKFSWATTTNSSGDEILKISYISGDKNTELFPGSSNTVLWSRQYVLTGNILNIYGGDGVWVFNRK